jgi:hypothetical protein
VPSVRQAVTLLAVVVTSACGPSGREPAFDPIEDQVGFVGRELSVMLRASDPDADALTFSFSAPQISDLASRADLRPYGQDSSQAIFRWTPNARDVGIWIIDFEVTDGSSAISESVTFDIKPGMNESPVFLQPLGSGTTLDLALAREIELDVVVEDPDNAQVTIEQEEPLIEKAVLTLTGATTAKWRWQPTAAQIEARSVYALTLSAYDGASPKTEKHYFIMLKKAPMPGCPGAAPVITHSPADVRSVLEIPLMATVNDDRGLKSGEPPLVHYSLTMPATPINLGMMTAVRATLTSGDMRSGTWSAAIPNPVASMPTGSQATVYYLWTASDNDDADDGDCDHTTTLPASGVFSMKVTNPGGAGNLMPCEECSADLQCGGAEDHCLNQSGGKYCGKACAGDEMCPQGYLCSLNPVTSVDGVVARQCMPRSSSCTMVMPTACMDDDREENDTPTQADAKPPIDILTSYQLKMCPLPTGSGVDVDWFRFVVEGEGDISVNLTGGAQADLDLQLTDDVGLLIDTSAASGSTESVGDCLQEGVYYAQVYSSTPMPTEATSYTLSVTGASRDCNPEVCVDDDGEDEDDDPNTAPLLAVDTQDKVEKADRQICADDSDFYELALESGDTLFVSLAFTQGLNYEKDLDLHLWEGATDLTPCTEEIPCSPENGQSGDDNEYLEWPITKTATYYLEVRGYQYEDLGPSENGYDLCVSIKPGQCVEL